jgi:hypothetical protein
MADRLICREDVVRNEGSVNLINSPTQRNARKLLEMVGSTRVLKEIAKIMGKEGEADSVLEKNRTTVQLMLKSASKELQGIKVAVPVGFSINLRKDIGVDVAALILYGLSRSRWDSRYLFCNSST